MIHDRSRRTFVGTLLVLILTVASLFVAIAASPIAASSIAASSPPPRVPGAAEVRQTIEAFLSGRAERLVSGKEHKQPIYAIPLSAAMTSSEASSDLALEARREWLRSDGVEFTDFTTTVEIVDTSVAGSTMTVTAREETELVYKRYGDEPPFTAYVDEHLFTFDYLDSGWVLASRRLTDGRMPPITEVTVEASIPAPARISDPDAASIDSPTAP